MIATLEALLSDPKWKAYIDLLNDEIRASETKALSSIGKDKPDKESYYRAKYLKEALTLPVSKISASKMNQNKTPIS
jgi:hypothetical protein